VKFFLNVSREEQRERFLERIENPEKHWKFSPGDVAESEHWDKYMDAYQKCLAATSTPWAPWYVIPADRKWVARAAVAAILTETIKGLDLAWPKVTAEQKQAIAKCKRQLERKP
jgi:polyphosphate kinase 2 (PPK2 family)